MLQTIIKELQERLTHRPRIDEATQTEQRSRTDAGTQSNDSTVCIDVAMQSETPERGVDAETQSETTHFGMNAGTQSEAPRIAVDAGT